MQTLPCAWVERPGLLRETLAIVGGGTALWTWLLAAAVRLRPPGRSGRWLLPALSALVVACLWYVAAHHLALLPEAVS